MRAATISSTLNVFQVENLLREPEKPSASFIFRDLHLFENALRFGIWGSKLSGVRFDLISVFGYRVPEP